MAEHPVILILGAGVMQGPALSIAREMGLSPVAADGDPKAPCRGLADRFEEVDLKDRQGIEDLALSLKKEGTLRGIMTAGTDFSATVAWAAEKLGLPGIPYETALDASDKERMRRRFKEAEVPSPEFIILSDPPGEGFQLPFPWPVVVKPVDNMGSRGCRRVDHPGDLSPAVAEALGFSRSGRAIIEEYMEGPEFSVDALVYQGEIIICGFADRHIFFPPYFIEMGHTIPSAEAPQTVASLLEVFSRGVKALGITMGAAKGDIKLSQKGPMIGEIAARLSGGYMSGWTFPYSSGVLPTRGALEIALGQRPSRTEPLWDWTCAERAFISIPGRVHSIQGIEESKTQPWVKDVYLRIKPGDSVMFPENNVSKGGNVLSAAPQRAEAIQSAEGAARSILIRLEVPNRATEAFLGAEPGTCSFPPDAFQLDREVLSKLSALPEGSPLGSGQGDLEIRIIPFWDFLRSGSADYVGRSAGESLDAVRLLSGRELPLEEGDRKGPALLLGRPFWAAMIRGGYQGALYFLDRLKGQ
ncbi:MAG: ATP-grasp domain-containing protein [Treponema sp.]|nr:ATP-grasp domain-containing protein [Treponema sp.]